MPFKYGKTGVISWNIPTKDIYTNDFSTHSREIKELGGVKVQVNYSRGDWSLTVVDIEPSTKMQLQFKALVKPAYRSEEVFLQQTWSEVRTFDAEHPTIEFANHVQLRDVQERDYLSLQVKVRSVFGTVSTRDPEWKLVPAITTTFNDQDSADAEIKVGDSTFKVHKLFLTLQSDVFKSMFEREWKEKQSNVVDIKEADEEVVEAMLHYMYSGQVKNIDKVADRLLLLSDQYHLEGLTGMCMKALGENLSLENIIERLQLLAYPEHLNTFKKPVFKFVKQNFTSICALPEWKNFCDGHKDIVYELLIFAFKQMDRSSIQENDRRNPEPNALIHAYLTYAGSDVSSYERDYDPYDDY
ncbi:BTB domain-containing protein [Aphelenchoides besseyi]|nr:BTB domain-containing protein [Aphelenchoides besseyi]